MTNKSSRNFLCGWTSWTTFVTLDCHVEVARKKSMPVIFGEGPHPNLPNLPQRRIWVGGGVIHCQKHVYDSKMCNT